MNLYLEAESILDAEERALVWGIRGEGFEVMEMIDG